MSTNTTKIKKLPLNLRQKALAMAPQRCLPNTPEKSNKKRATSSKRFDKKKKNQTQNRAGRAQTYSYSTTTETNGGIKMSVTYYFNTNNNTNTNTIYFNNNNNNNNTTNTISMNEGRRTTHLPQSSYHKMLPLAPTMQNVNMEYCYLDKVDLNDNRQGTIKFIGEISVYLKGEIWYGIHLRNQRGQNDGSLRGQRYFKCNPKYGTFVQRKNIRWLWTENNNDEINNDENDNDEQELDLDAADRFHINEIVRIKGKNGKAQIRCICEIDDELRFGVELLNDMGDHSGTIHGKFYFSCGLYRGLFVNQEQIISLKQGDPLKDDKKIDIDDDDDIMSPVMDDEESDSDSDEENANFFEEMQLNEEDQDMVFTHIMNKLKNERNDLEETEEENEEEEGKCIASEEYNDDDEDEEQSPSFLKPIGDIKIMESLQSSNTSPAADIGLISPIAYDDIDINMNIMAAVEESVDEEDDEEVQTPQPDAAEVATPPFVDPPEQSVFVAPANQGIMDQIDDKKEEHVSTSSKVELPGIATTPIQNVATCDYTESPMLSPLLTPGSLSVDALNTQIIEYNAENSHLKEFPDSPFDVNTTKREFSVTSTTIQLGCNNPHKLFLILHAMVGRLYLNTMKYRSLNANSAKIKAKLLNYEGVEEFFNLLGFERNENGNKLECDLNQPPLSVLNDAITVLTKFIVKTGQKRAMVDRMKKYQTMALVNLDELKTDLFEAENERETPNKIQMETPTQQQTFSEMIVKHDEKQQIKHQQKHSQQQTILEIEVDAVFDETEEDEDDEEEEEDDELEANHDHFKLSDIIHSITHPQNEDNSAITIVLLCYPLFCSSTELFICLNRRFFGCNNNFDIQQKVILFIKEWINKYFEQDWISNNNELKLVFDKFVDKMIDDLNDPKYQKMVDYLLEIQDVDNNNKTLKRTMKENAICDNKYGLKRIDKTLQFEAVQFENKLNEKHYDFLKLNNNLIAQQLTIIDFEYFSSIKQRECVGQSWKKKNKYEIARNICDCIDNFNRFTIWVQSRILLCDSTKKRAKIIKKFIKICEILFCLRNFQSLHAIFGGLNSSEIMRLKKAWHQVPRKHLMKFEEFKVMFSSKKNMANLRKLHRETYPPMIPYIGIFLQDLFQIEEGNKKTKNDGTINFSLLLRLSNVIDSILKYQQIKYKNIKNDKKLKQLLLNEFKINQNLSQDIMWKLSNNAKKIDEKKRFGFNN